MILTPPPPPPTKPHIQYLKCACEQECLKLTISVGTVKNFRQIDKEIQMAQSIRQVCVWLNIIQICNVMHVSNNNGLWNQWRAFNRIYNNQALFSLTIKIKANTMCIRFFKTITCMKFKYHTVFDQVLCNKILISVKLKMMSHLLTGYLSTFLSLMTKISSYFRGEKLSKSSRMNTYFYNIHVQFIIFWIFSDYQLTKTT